MKPRAPERSRLSLVHDATKLTIAGVPAVLGARRPPFAVDAAVLEDDRFHVLAADPGFREPGEPALLVRTRALEVEPATLGSVVPRLGVPPVLLAVVHDLDQTPSCRAASVRAAYEALLAHVALRGLRALSLPLLGTRFGGLPDALAARLLVEALLAHRPPSLQRVFLALGARDPRPVHDALRRAGEAISPDRG